MTVKDRAKLKSDIEALFPDSFDDQCKVIEYINTKLPRLELDIRQSVILAQQSTLSGIQKYVRKLERTLAELCINRFDKGGE